jgi:surfeit locus 1 family protein
MGAMRMFLRPRWLVVHAVVLALAVLFVNLGFWQLRRLDERRADNARITANLSQPVEPLEQTLAVSGNDPQGLAYRRVRVSGRYRPADEVLLTPRSNGNVAGHHVLTPLVVAEDQAVLVDRGWVPFADDEPPIAAAAPPSGAVSVSGILIPTSEAGRYGSAVGGETLTYLSGPDVDRIQPQVDVSLYPFSILLQEQTPASGDLPVPGELPAVDEGSHQSYAWQWFAFTAILLLGYPLLLRRSLQGRRGGAPRRRTVAAPTASG